MEEMHKRIADAEKRWVASIDDGFWRGLLGLPDATPGERWLSARGEYYERG